MYHYGAAAHLTTIGVRHKDKGEPEPRHPHRTNYRPNLPE